MDTLFNGGSTGAGLGVWSELANFPVSWTVQPLHFQRLPEVSSKPPLLPMYNSLTSPVYQIYNLKSHTHYTPFSSTALCCDDFSIFATARCQSESYLSWRMEKLYPTVIGFFCKKHNTAVRRSRHEPYLFMHWISNVYTKTSLFDTASWCGRKNAKGGGGGT